METVDCLQVIALLEKEISASAWFGTAYLVDGFPRAVTQAESFEQRVRPCDLVLYFECPEQEMVARLTERGKSSGRQAGLRKHSSHKKTFLPA